jgi:2'-5' RNA ligase
VQPRTDLYAMAKGNPHHDDKGRFASGSGGGAGGDYATSYAGVTDSEWMDWAADPEPFKDALEGVRPKYHLGDTLSDSDADQVMDAAQRIQQAALTHGVKEPGTLYRGESYATAAEVQAKYKYGNKVANPTLTSTATAQDIAMEYARSDNAQAVPVVLRYQNPNGIRGVQTAPMGVPTNEVVLPKGDVYRVARVQTRADGTWLVDMYSTEKHKGVKMVDASGPQYAHKALVTHVAKEGQTGAMIGFWLPSQVAKLLVQHGATEPVDELHLTVAYFGKAADMPPEKQAALVRIAQEYCAASPPLTGQISGVGRFAPSAGSEGQEVIYASFDCPNLVAFRQGLLSRLERAGITCDMQHGYTPHITLAYVQSEKQFGLPTSAPKSMVTFGALTVALAGQRTQCPLGGLVLKEGPRTDLYDLPVQKADNISLIKAAYEKSMQEFGQAVTKFSAAEVGERLYRVTDGWGERYYLVEGAKAVPLATKMADARAFWVDKARLDDTHHPRTLGWSNEKWDAALKEWARSQVAKQVTATILKADEHRQLVYGVVLEPDMIDSQLDVMRASEIEAAAHYYLNFSRVVGDRHRKKANAEVVESYIAPVDFDLNGQRVKKGSWVLVVHITDPYLWQQVKQGLYTGFSVGGFGERREVR